jgi:hypothetical protein
MSHQYIQVRNGVDSGVVTEYFCDLHGASPPEHGEGLGTGLFGWQGVVICISFFLVAMGNRNSRLVVGSLILSGTAALASLLDLVSGVST